MTSKTQILFSPLQNNAGKAVAVVIAVLLVFALAGGGGYWAHGKYYKKAPLKTRLSSMKVREELVRFTHDRVSTALYHNMVVVDDVVVMMDRELDRLKRIGKKFPKQNGIVASQVKELGIARERLSGVLAEVTASIEEMYVTWLVNRSEGTGQIRSQKGTLTRLLADAIRGEAVLIGRIRTNPDATT